MNAATAPFCYLSELPTTRPSNRKFSNLRRDLWQSKSFVSGLRGISKNGFENNTAESLTHTSRQHKAKRTGIRGMFDFFRMFFSVSSIHGFEQLATNQRHFTEYALWAVTLVFAFGCALLVSRLSWRRYQYYPTVVSIEKDYHNWYTTFPTATICPSAAYKVEGLAKKYSPENPEAFSAFLTELSRFPSTNLSSFNLGLRPDRYMKILIEAVRDFNYNTSNSFGAKEDVTEIITEMGNCIIVNSEVASFFSPQKFYNTDNRKEEKKITALSVSPPDGEMFIQILKMSFPYSVWITSSSEIPDFSTVPITRDKDTYTDLNVKAFTIISSENVRSLSVDQRKCRFYDESNLQVSQIYTYTLCRMECRLNLAFELCKCIPYFYKKMEGKAYCNITGLNCFHHHSEYLINLREPNSNKKVDCNCYPMCTDTHFIFHQIELHHWQLDLAELRFGINLYPKIRYKREVIFGISDLLISIGATAGLFMGCSVLSFIEIIYYFLLRFLIHMMKRENTSS